MAGSVCNCVPGGPYDADEATTFFEAVVGQKGDELSLLYRQAGILLVNEVARLREEVEALKAKPWAAVSIASLYLLTAALSRYENWMGQKYDVAREVEAELKRREGE